MSCMGPSPQKRQYPSIVVIDTTEGHLGHVAAKHLIQLRRVVVPYSSGNILLRLQCRTTSEGSLSALGESVAHGAHVVHCAMFGVWKHLLIPY